MQAVHRRLGVALRNHTWEAHDDKIILNLASKCNFPSLPTSALLCSPIGWLALHSAFTCLFSQKGLPRVQKLLSFPEAVTGVLSHTLHGLKGS